jgi:hypothetical protein
MVCSEITEGSICGVSVYEFCMASKTGCMAYELIIITSFCMNICQYVYCGLTTKSTQVRKWKIWKSMTKCIESEVILSGKYFDAC